jgi:hypothetical protein
MFPKRSAAPDQSESSSERTAASEGISALPAGGGLGIEPEQLFAQIEENRASANPGRAQLEMRLKLRAMNDAEIIALAERMVAGDFALTTYELTFFEGVWTRFTSIDPQRAHRDALLLPTRSMRTRAARIATEAWAISDPAGAFAALISAKEEGADKDFDSLDVAIQTLAMHDPERALGLLEAHRDAKWFAHARSSLLYGWGIVDEAAAAGWLRSEMVAHPSEAGSLLRDIGMGSPEDALKTALSLEPTAQLREAVAQIIGSQWRFRNPKAAATALASLPVEWHSTQLAREFGMNGVTDAPVEGIESTAAAFPTEELRESFWGAVIGRRASDAKFDDAIALLQKLPTGEVRGDGAADVASYWAKLNPAEASEWLSTLEPGIERDRAVGSFAETIAPLDLGGARRWAESIADEQLRERALERIQ